MGFLLRGRIKARSFRKDKKHLKDRGGGEHPKGMKKNGLAGEEQETESYPGMSHSQTLVINRIIGVLQKQAD